MKGSSKGTPIRLALLAASSLESNVEDGIAALETSHRRYLEQGIRREFDDSLNIDEALLEGHEQENRWDYLLGHGPSTKVIALEPHSAKQDQISTVIKKREAAKAQLREHLKEGVQIASWLWVASGRVYFANTERARLRLAQNGIQFVGGKVLAKHLPAQQAPAQQALSKKAKG